MTAQTRRRKQRTQTPPPRLYPAYEKLLEQAFSEVKLIPLAVDPVETARRLVLIRNKLSYGINRTPARVRQQAVWVYWTGTLASLGLALGVIAVGIAWAYLGYPPPWLLLYEPWYGFAAFCAGLLLAAMPGIWAYWFRNKLLRSLGKEVNHARQSVLIIFDVAVVKALIRPKKQ